MGEKESITAWELKWKESIESIYLSSPAKQSSTQWFKLLTLLLGSKWCIHTFAICCMCWELKSQIVLIVYLYLVRFNFLFFSFLKKITQANFNVRKGTKRSSIDKKKYQLTTRNSLIYIFIVWILELTILLNHNNFRKKLSHASTKYEWILILFQKVIQFSQCFDPFYTRKKSLLPKIMKCTNSFGWEKSSISFLLHDTMLWRLEISNTLNCAYLLDFIRLWNDTWT